MAFITHYLFVFIEQFCLSNGTEICVRFLVGKVFNVGKVNLYNSLEGKKKTRN